MNDQAGSNWDVIVIGSGIGGMAAATALARYKRRVLLLEQHYVLGGFTHTFSRKGFTWDVGVHCLGQLGPGMQIRRIMDWIGAGKLEFEPFGKVYETFHFPNGETFEFPDSKADFITSLKAWFPDEHRAIDLYFKAVSEAVRANVPYFPLRTLPESLIRIGERLIDRAGVRWRGKTTEQVFKEIGASPRLSALLSAQWGYYGEPPSRSSFALHASCIAHFFNGAWFPVGNASKFGEILKGEIESRGGKVLTRSPVAEILVEGGKARGVVLKNGTEFFAKKVISCTGAKASLKMIPESTNIGFAWRKEIESFENTPAYFSLYLGFEGDIAKAGATRSSQWIYETWNQEDGIWNLSKDEVPPALFCSFPSLKDPHHDAGPTQRHTGELVTFADWKDFEKWSFSRRGNRPTDYIQFKKTIEDRIFRLFEQRFPELAKLVVYRELSTPLSTAFFNTGATHGAIYGLEHTPRRFASSALRTRTPLKNFYIGGCDVASCGIAGGLVGGLLAAATLEPRVFAQIK